MHISTELGMIEVWRRPFNTNGDCSVAQRDFDLVNDVDVICWPCSGCVVGDHLSERVVFNPACHQCHCHPGSTDMVPKRVAGSTQSARHLGIWIAAWEAWGMWFRGGTVTHIVCTEGPRGD